MDNKFLDEVLEIARKEWKGTVERELARLIKFYRGGITCHKN